MEDGKDREEKVSQKLKCDMAKFNLSYYLNRKHVDDSTTNLSNLWNIRSYDVNTLIDSSLKPILTKEVHKFKNDKKEKEKNSLVAKMFFLKSSAQVVVGYNRSERGDINFIDASKPRVLEPYYKELAGGLGGLTPFQNGRKVMIADRKGKFVFIDTVSKNLKDINDSAKMTEVQGVLDISLSPSETKVACGSKEKVILIFDIPKGMILEKNFMSNHNDSVTSVMWHPYKSLLISGSLDYTVKLWDIRNQQSICSSKYHQDAVNKCVFAVDGNTYFSMGKDKRIFEYDLRMKGVITKFVMEEETKDMQVLPNCLVAGDALGNIRWFSRSGELIHSHKGESGVLALTVDQSENWMIVARKDNQIFELYETGSYFI